MQLRAQASDDKLFAEVWSAQNSVVNVPVQVTKYRKDRLSYAGLIIASSGASRDAVRLGGRAGPIIALNILPQNPPIKYVKWNVDDLGGAISHELWLEQQLIGQFGNLYVTELWCRDCYKIPSKSKMPQYDYRNTTVVLGGIGVATRVLLPNRNRVGYTVSLNNPSGIANHLSTWSVEQATGDFYFLVMPGSATLSYRDFGPIVKESLWIRATQAAATASVAEILIVPKS